MSMLTMDLVIESKSQDTLNTVWTQVLERGLEVVPVYEENDPIAQDDADLLRLHIPISNDDDERSSVSIAGEFIASNSDFMKDLLQRRNEISKYVLIFASCGSQEKYSRSISLEPGLLAACASLGLSIVLSVFPMD